MSLTIGVYLIQFADIVNIIISGKQYCVGETPHDNIIMMQLVVSRNRYVLLTTGLV